MSLKPVEKENEDEFTITEQREDFMVSPSSSDGNPTFRAANFLKPLLNPNIQSLPKTPFLFVTSNPNMTENVAKKVVFRCNYKPESSWKSWVDELQNTHQSIWKKVGIFDAIKCSTYNIERDNQLIKCLAEKWCIDTNTFVFSWGESTITLEDIMILGGFSVLGDSVSSFLCSKKFAEIKDELVKTCSVINKKCYYLSLFGWMDHFKGKGGDIEHVAFIIVWLSRYVFHSKQKCRINKSVFDIAISLAMGDEIALAPAVLASIYRDLTLLKERIVCQNRKGVVDRSELVLCAPFHLLQLWAWERFPALSPEPNCLVEDQPRVARWHNVTKLKSLSVRSDIESNGDSFIWRPYAVCMKNWDPKYYCDSGMWVVINSEVDEKLLSFVRCLRASELVGLDCVMQYLPHRVGMQFGMDQDIPNYVPRSNANFECAWSSCDKPLKGLKLYIPPRLFEGDVTMQYARWWRQLSALGDDALITYPRRTKSARKLKSLYELLKDMESQKQQKVLNVIASSTGLDEQEDTGMYDAYTISERDKRDLVDEHAQDTEAVDLGLVGIGSDKPNDISSFLSESIEPQIADIEATKTDLDKMVNSLVGEEVEEHFEQRVMKVDEKRELSQSFKSMCQGEKSTEGTCSLGEQLTKDKGLSGEGPSIDAELNALVGEQAEDLQDIAEEGANTKQLETSMEDILVIGDEEDASDCNLFESFFKDFEVRINELNKLVSTLKAKRAGQSQGEILNQH